MQVIVDATEDALRHALAQVAGDMQCPVEGAAVVRVALESVRRNHAAWSEHAEADRVKAAAMSLLDGINTRSSISVKFSDPGHVEATKDMQQAMKDLLSLCGVLDASAHEELQLHVEMDCSRDEELARQLQADMENEWMAVPRDFLLPLRVDVDDAPVEAAPVPPPRRTRARKPRAPADATGEIDGGRRRGRPRRSEAVAVPPVDPPPANGEVAGV
jgi:hypothetical protein